MTSSLMIMEWFYEEVQRPFVLTEVREWAKKNGYKYSPKHCHTSVIRRKEWVCHKGYPNRYERVSETRGTVCPKCGDGKPKVRALCAYCEVGHEP